MRVSLGDHPSAVASLSENPCRRRLDRMRGKLVFACGGLHLHMAEQYADRRQTLADEKGRHVPRTG